MSSLQTRLTVLWIVVLVLAGRELISLPGECDRIEAAARTQLRTVAHAVANSVSSSFTAVDIGLQGLNDQLLPKFAKAGPSAISGSGPESIKALLIRQRDRMPGVTAIALTDATGKVIASTVSGLGETRLNDSGYFRLLRGGVRDAPAISQALRSRLTGEMSMVVARRVESADGAFAGILVANIGLESHFGAFFRSLATSPSTGISLLDHDQRVMMHLPQDESLIGRHVSFPLSTRDPATGEVALRAMSAHAGEDRIGLLLDLGAFPLTLGISERRDVILQPWHASRDKSILYVLLLLTGGGLLTRRLFISSRLETKTRLDASVFVHASEGILITEPDGTIIDCNPRMEEMTAYRRDEIIGQTPRLFSSNRHGPSFFNRLWEELQHKHNWRGEMWNKKKTGELYAQQASISAVRDDAGRLTHYVGLFTDITPLKNQADLLREQANHDPLTRLPNRSLLRERLQQTIARARRQQGRIALCYVDLDEFKPINDSLGHAAGDRVLIEIAHRMRANLRGGDTAARIGGDEFVVLFNHLADVEECRLAVERLLTAITEPIMIEGRQLRVSASIGVAMYPRDADGADELIALADAAMYEAKRGGRNRYSECA